MFAAYPIQVSAVLSPTAEVRALISALDRELAQHYPPEQRHGLRLEAILQPHVRFFVAWMNESAAGCGGVALFSDFAEIKRMYVRPEARSQGVADAIMTRLAMEVLDAGLTLLRLETGTHQIAAIRFYRRHGFQPCPAFEPYASMPPHAIATSVFLERQA